MRITTTWRRRSGRGWLLLTAALLLIGCEEAVSPDDPPGKASNPSPRHNATDVSQDTDLKWAKASDATGYRVYFGTDSSPDDGEFKREQEGTTFDPGPLKPSTTYYWRVDSENDDGRTTGNVWKFKTAGSDVPTDPTPAHEATGVAPNTNLEWTAAAGATSYLVFFGTDPSPDNSELFITPVVATTFDPGMLEYSTIYYWRVDSQNERGTVRGDVWQFTTASRPRPKPEKAATPTPAHEETAVPIRNTRLGWAADPRATSYLVYFGTVASPGSDERQGGWQSGTTFDPPNLLEYDTRYCWRVDTKNEGGITIGDVWCFTTEAAPVEKVTNPQPADKAVNIDVFQDLGWTAAPDATSYVVYLGTSLPLGTADRKREQSGTTFDAELEYNTDYYWRIDSKGNGHLTVGDVWSFTTAQAPTTGALVTRE